MPTGMGGQNDLGFQRQTIAMILGLHVHVGLR